MPAKHEAEQRVGGDSAAMLAVSPVVLLLNLNSERTVHVGTSVHCLFLSQSCSDGKEANVLCSLGREGQKVSLFNIFLLFLYFLVDFAVLY